MLAFLKKLIPTRVFNFFQPIYHHKLALLAALWYGFPSRSLTVIGITGTDGKTTTVHLLHEMFAAAGYSVGSLSSLRFKINNQEEKNLLKMTMPGKFRLQKFLADCKRAGCRFAVIEVTSQGIAQRRHRFIHFSGAVLTNITPEHIESHGGFEQYRQAKIKLFRVLPKDGIAVLNREDASADMFAGATHARVAWYSKSVLDVGGTQHQVGIRAVTATDISLTIDEVDMETTFGGDFNVMNILAAAATVIAFRVPLAAIAKALGTFPGMPGRLEYVAKIPFSVVVDYANTPAAYETLYKTLGENLVCVLGAPGGGRDRWKRPEIGRIAAQYCKEVVFTSDDPDDEDPNQIADELKSAIPNDSTRNVKVIIDRREAIHAALADARPLDTVVITGMGAQPWFISKGHKIPWDDREVAREELASARYSTRSQETRTML